MLAWRRRLRSPSLSREKAGQFSLPASSTARPSAGGRRSAMQCRRGGDVLRGVVSCDRRPPARAERAALDPSPFGTRQDETPFLGSLAPAPRSSSSRSAVRPRRRTRTSSPMARASIPRFRVRRSSWATRSARTTPATTASCRTCRELARLSSRASYQEIGETYEHRAMPVLTVTSPQNHARLESIRQEHLQSIEPGSPEERIFGAAGDRTPRIRGARQRNLFQRGGAADGLLAGRGAGRGARALPARRDLPRRTLAQP